MYAVIANKGYDDYMSRFATVQCAQDPNDFSWEDSDSETEEESEEETSFKLTMDAIAKQIPPYVTGLLDGLRKAEKKEIVLTTAGIRIDRFTTPSGFVPVILELQGAIVLGILQELVVQIGSSEYTHTEEEYSLSEPWSLDLSKVKLSSGWTRAVSALGRLSKLTVPRAGVEGYDLLPAEYMWRSTVQELTAFPSKISEIRADDGEVVYSVPTAESIMEHTHGNKRQRVEGLWG